MSLLFYQSTSLENFAAAFVAEYDDSARALRYVNCGHNPPLVLRNNGSVERLEPTSLVLGAFRRFTASSAQTRLEQRDWLILFSDGIVEAQSEYGDMYGEQRLIDVAVKNKDGGVNDMLAKVRESLDAFAAPVGRDDWTLVAARGI